MRIIEIYKLVGAWGQKKIQTSELNEVREERSKRWNLNGCGEAIEGLFNDTSGRRVDRLIRLDSHKLLTADLSRRGRRDWHPPFPLCPPTRSFPPFLTVL